MLLVAFRSSFHHTYTTSNIQRSCGEIAKTKELFSLWIVFLGLHSSKMDVLSSMANIAGYKADDQAANAYGGFLVGK